MTKPLSPAAQAVLDAFLKAPMGQSHVDDDLIAVTATLRAAADQVFPVPNDWDKDNISEQGLWLLRLKRDQLIAIASELEGGND